ncbi:unnamed protein product, partial [Mesorhabditis spiculigera]
MTPLFNNVSKPPHPLFLYVWVQMQAMSDVRVPNEIINVLHRLILQCCVDCTSCAFAYFHRYRICSTYPRFLQHYPSFSMWLFCEKQLASMRLPSSPICLRVTSQASY